MNKSSGSETSIEQAVERIMKAPYTRELHPNEDGSWFARIVELSGCMTEGATKGEALENLDDAMREWIRVQLEDGVSIPLPLSESRYSGKLVVRMTPELHRALAEKATREGVSLNSLICTILARGLSSVTSMIANAFSGSTFVSFFQGSQLNDAARVAALVDASQSATQPENNLEQYLLSERQTKRTSLSEMAALAGCP